MLQSHFDPYKSLSDHIAEVQQAADHILLRHSPVVRGLVKDWVPLAVTFHDIGKGTAAFQRYIENPNAYKGTKESKSHTPMSLYWWYSYAFHHQLDFETTLAVAVAVWKHHSAFPTYNGAIGIQESVSQYLDLLQRQLENLDLNALDEALQLTLSDTPPTKVSGSVVSHYFYRNSLPDDRPGQPNGTVFRLRIQFLFSILLEADKAFLAMVGSVRAAYMSPPVAQIPTDLVSRLFPPGQSKLDQLRTQMRQSITAQPLYPVSLVSLPTGLGKTMVAAEWFLKHRISTDGKPRKVIVVLPFLSIIDQTVKEYKRLLSQSGLSDCILESHSLSGDIQFTPDQVARLDQEDADAANEDGQDFLSKIWHKPIVITTFDQFLYALLSPKGKHQMRFHNISDALIVMDEIQALPTRLWTLFSNVVEAMSSAFNTNFLLMSATQPGFIKNPTELVRDAQTVFRCQNRYTLVLKHRNPTDIQDFIQECTQRLETDWQNERVLIVLNTRGSAKKVLKALKPLGTQHLGAVYFISGDVTPKERLEQIAKIKNGDPCLVIATQCIEAGVDIDMTLVIRDFAPLDSLIQVAGRGNRNNRMVYPCPVEVVKLTSKNKPYCDIIYGRDNDPFLEKTAVVLMAFDTIQEQDIYPIIQAYFKEINISGNVGNAIARDWAKWDPVNVQEILRGNLEKLEFIVLNQDPDLESEIEKALQLPDKWEKTRQLQILASRVSAISISVWAKPGLRPEKIARPIGYWWALYDTYYVSCEGLIHPDDRDIETIIL